MICPRCSEEYKCPCKSCVTHMPSKWKFKTRKGVETIKCSGCGLEKHPDWWLGEEVRQLRAKGLWPSE